MRTRNNANDESRGIYDFRVKLVFFFLAAFALCVTGRIIYLQAIFPNTKPDKKKIEYFERLPAYKVKNWEELEDSKSKLRSMFTQIRKYALSASEEAEYENKMYKSEKRYVYLMPYVYKKIKEVKHPIKNVNHERGRIYSSDGSLLAGNETIYDIAFLRDKFHPDKNIRESQIRKILEIVGIKYDDPKDEKAAEIKKSLKGKDNWIPIAYKVSSDLFKKLRKLNYECLGARKIHIRIHPLNLALDTLGDVKYKDNNKLFGLEQVFDIDLHSRVEEVDKQMHPELTEKGTSENAPKDLHLTIDRNFQKAAQEIMESWNKAIRKNEKKSFGLLIVQESNTGRILAMASTKETPGQNLFVQNAYEPGSTLKTVTFAALIDSKTAKETDYVHIGLGKSNPWQLKNVKIHDDHDWPNEQDMTLRRVIELSSNIGTGRFVQKLGAEKLYQYYEALGFGKQTGIELPLETSGVLHPLKLYKRDITQLVTSSYGHGIMVSPIQLISAYSAMINGGTYYQPYLVEHISDRDGNVVMFPEHKEPVRVFEESTSAKVRSVLRGVMENGTGREIKLDGYILAGKTGTANLKKGKGYADKEANALFVGFFPYEHPKYTIMAIFDHPEKDYRYGSKSALPVYAEMVSKIAEIKHIPKDNIKGKDKGNKAK